MEAVLTLVENRFSPCIEGPPVTQFCPTALQRYGLPNIFKNHLNQSLSSLHSGMAKIFYFFPEGVNTELVGGIF